MKILKKLMVLAILIFPLFAQAQPSTEILPLKVYKNEIGTDIISLTRLVLDFNGSEPNNIYQATYQLTYKRHFNKFSLRFGIGGRSFSRESDAPNLAVDKLKSSGQNFRYRIGMEKKSKIGKRWDFYYGADFRHSIQINNTEGSTSNGYIRGRKLTSNIFGLAPLIGIEFQINNRISLQTEAGFFAFLSKQSDEDTYRQISGMTVVLPTSATSEVDQWGTTFSVPNFLVLSIKL